MTGMYRAPSELVLGTRINDRVPRADQERQRLEVDQILRRLRSQPGVVLADEVGMGKTYVALAVAYSVAVSSPRGPVVVMVPANIVGKWVDDFAVFCESYLEGGRRAVASRDEQQTALAAPASVRYGVARNSVELLRLLDDERKVRCHVVFLAQGAMARRQSDKWVRLALIAEALRKHGRGKAERLIQVKSQIHRFMGELIWAIGEEKAHGLGEGLWQRLLTVDFAAWKEVHNSATTEPERRLSDDPVPKAVVRALRRADLRPLAEALREMPVRARGGRERVSERIGKAREALKRAERHLWNEMLANPRWRSPLLVMDEAHHLKNPGAALAKQLQSPEVSDTLGTGDGAMARAFDRMLFLTATPFQLGHHELVSVLERFGDVRWDPQELGERDDFLRRLCDLRARLDESQRSAILLQRAWGCLTQEDADLQTNEAWRRAVAQSRDTLTPRVRAAVDAYSVARRQREDADRALRTWVVRHNKDALWTGTQIARRERIDGEAAAGASEARGIAIPSDQMLAFFLAARSAVRPGQDLLGEALSSSYEAFRFTRKNRRVERDERDDDAPTDLSHATWYLKEFDAALRRSEAAKHPKVDATVRRVVDLWSSGEKVLVFAHYRQTCRALRRHIGAEIERRVTAVGCELLRAAGLPHTRSDLERLLVRVQSRYFDDADAPGRVAVDAALGEILEVHDKDLDGAGVAAAEHDKLLEVMRRFLRVQTTLVRYFPLAEVDSLPPAEAVRRVLDEIDSSGISWRSKFDAFIDFLANRCTGDERSSYLVALSRSQTGGIRVESKDAEDEEKDEGVDDQQAGPAADATVVVANVKVATGQTKREVRERLMRSFNTPFFPDVLVCSQVMSEGVDLQRSCRHVIHHDLAWNPSTIEQRTGRVDRLGCKAERRHPIMVYVPYLAGTADERQYRVMSDREQWFRVVMGQDAVAKLITPESERVLRLPPDVVTELTFRLGLGDALP